MEGKETLDAFLKRRGELPPRRPRPAQPERLPEWMANIRIGEPHLPEQVHFDEGQPGTSKAGQIGEQKMEGKETLDAFLKRIGDEWPHLQLIDEKVPVKEPSSPTQLSVKYKEYEGIGQCYLKPWGEPNNAQYYQDILASHQFEINWKYSIFKMPDKFDHSVWRVYKHEGGLKTVYACKIVSFKYYVTKFTDFKTSLRAMLKESKILMKLDHINVIKVIQTISLEDKETKFPHVFKAIIMEFMNESLINLMKISPGKVLTADDSKEWFKQVATGIEYLHYNIRSAQGDSLVVTHMAITPRNILYQQLSSRYGSVYVFKLADFEECNVFRLKNVSSTQFNEDFVQSYGNKPYLHTLSAPELFNSNWRQLHARPTDIYSLCMSLCYTMCGGSSLIGVFVKTLLRDLKPNSPEPMRLVNKMLSRDPARRPTIGQILQNEWVRPQPYEQKTESYPSVPSFLRKSCE